MRIFVLTVLAMLAFAGNSLLCRLALRAATIDAGTFTFVRVASGAIVLFLIAVMRTRSFRPAGNWWSAAALFVYAAAFSFAYINLSVATGALLLFGAVQVTMIGVGLTSGEHLNGTQWFGFAVALGGLVWLLLPGLSAPPLGASLLMIAAGIAWGIYSLRGRGAGDPTLMTAGNFVRAVPMALLLLVVVPDRSASSSGVIYAIASGAITSGLGYAIWYSALPSLRATTAASVQLSVPVITSVLGVLLLGETLSLRIVVASAAVLGGIGLIIARATRTTQ